MSFYGNVYRLGRFFGKRFELVVLGITLPFIILIFNYDTTPKGLNSIPLILQPPGSYWCGAACIMMVEHYFFGYSSSMQYTFQNISHISGNGSDMRKMTNYLEDRGLYSNLVTFTDLRPMLSYLQKNQIPAVMNLSYHPSSRISHAVVFNGFNSRKNNIVVFDPAGAPFLYKYDLLEYRMRSIGNRMIITNDKTKDKIEYLCLFCGEIKYIEAGLLDIIRSTSCNHTGRDYDVHFIRSNILN